MDTPIVEANFNSLEIGNLWEENASLWINLVSQGYDLYRDLVNTPGFFSILPNINGLSGLDIGCGEGHNTRLLAQRGAKMSGLDISPTFIRHAQKKEQEKSLGINFVHGNAIHLPFENESFDFTTAFVSFIDIPEYKKAIKESYRVLKPGGFFQFSITHPCFWTPDLEWITDSNGKKRAMACKDYFVGEGGTIQEWIFDGVDTSTLDEKKSFKSPIFRRTLSQWINSLIETGFSIEKFEEPKPTQEALEKYPAIEGSNIVPFFLIIRCRKPN